MVTQQLLFKFLLMSTLHWVEVLGQDKNDTSSTIGPRVVGGNVVRIEDVGGFIVTLRYSGEYRCGGTLIYDRIVLTAAHCFSKRSNTALWTVVAGVSTLGEMGVRRGVKAYRIPEAFSLATLEMDVAVVLLKTPLPQSWKIGTPLLCQQPLWVGTRVTILGYGSTRAGYKGVGYHLSKAGVHILDHEYCAKTYRAAYRISNSMLCAGVLGYRDACNQDSGSPLLYGNQVCGLVSFGDRCASIVHPGVYVDIYNVKSFISRSVSTLVWLR